MAKKSKKIKVYIAKNKTEYKSTDFIIISKIQLKNTDSKPWVFWRWEGCKTIILRSEVFREHFDCSIKKGEQILAEIPRVKIKVLERIK